jgi:hypothetical protein
MAELVNSASVMDGKSDLSFSMIAFSSTGALASSRSSSARLMALCVLNDFLNALENWDLGTVAP